MALDQEQLQKAKDLIKTRQYDRARLILQGMGAHPTAQDWLKKLDTLDPAPRTFEQAQLELAEVQGELQAAEQEIAQEQQQTRRALRFNTAIFVFLGSLLGSLIGAAADVGQAIDTVDRLNRQYFYPEMCVSGSDTILGTGIAMAEDWRQAFEASYRVQVKVNPVGSVRGIENSAARECVDVLAMSEPMTSEQHQQLTAAGVEIVCAAEIGYDVIGFATDFNNEISAIVRRDLRRILVGEINNWADINAGQSRPVYILARPGSGTTDYVLRNIANHTDTENFPSGANYIACSSNEDCLNRALSLPGSLYWVSTAWMKTQPPRYLRVIPVLRGDEAPVNPLGENVNLDNYPGDLIRPLYMFVLRTEDTDPETLQLAQAFLNYVRGVQGQQILEENHFFNHFDHPREVEVPLPPGFAFTGDASRQICQP